MSSKSNHLGTMPMLSAKSALKSFAHKADDTDKTPDNKSFSPMASARSILPNEKTFDATVLNDFSKKVNDALEKMFTKTHRFCTKLSRGISRIAKAYFRILLACAIVTFGYGFLFNLVDANPAIVENVPAIATLLESLKVLASYTGQFLHMNVEWAIEIIESIIEEINSTSI